MPDYKLKGRICEDNTVITASTTYAKILDIDGMAGAIAIHILSDVEVTINVECSALENVFTTPNGWTDIVHAGGQGYYEIAIPICVKAKINLKATSGDVTVSCAMAGA